MPVAPTNLTPGGVALLGFNGTGRDDFSFVLMTSVSAGTVIYFTDAGALSGHGFTSEDETSAAFPEGVVAWTASTNYAAGTVINYVDAAAEFSTPFQTTAGSRTGGVDFAEAFTSGGVTTGGDQLIAFQADLAGGNLIDPRFLFAIQSNSNMFSRELSDPEGPDANNVSALPPGLIDGDTALALGFGPGEMDAVSNLVYTGPTTGTTAELRAALADPANWTSDSGALIQKTADFTVTDAPSPGNADPAIVLSSPLVATEDTPLAITSLSVTDFESDDLTVVLSAPGAMSVTGLATVAGNGTGLVTISGAFAAVNAALATLTYTPSPNGTADEDITISVSDDVLTFVTDTVTVQITPVDDAPVISGTDAAVQLTTGDLAGGAQLLFTDPAFSDVDTSDFKGGKLKVKAVSGGLATDQVSIRDTFVAGVSTVQGLSVDGAEVFYHLDLTGTIPPIFTPFKIGDITSDGSNGSDLVIDFTAAATAVSQGIIDDLLGAVTFGSSAPAAGTRTLEVAVESPSGGPVSNIASTEVTVVPANAAPALSDLDTGVSIPNSVVGNPQVIDGDITLADADSTDLDGGSLTVSFGPLRDPAAENLSIADSGIAGSGINVAGTAVSFDGVAIGTISSNGQSGADLVVDFSAGATPAAAEALIEALRYSKSAASPSGGRDVTITVSDGDGGISTPQTINVQITTPPPPPDRTITYTERDPLSVIDDEAVLDAAYPASGSWAGGSLTVSITAGGVAAEDILDVSSIAGKTFVDFFGNVGIVRPDGSFVTIGALSGGTGGAPLVIAFAGGFGGGLVQTSDIEILLGAIGYGNGGGDDPTGGDRTVNFALRDSASNVQDLGDLTVDVNPVEDVPQIAGLTTSVAFDTAVVNASPVVIDSSVTVSDPDTADFSGGRLSVGNPLGGLAGDQLSVGAFGLISVSGRDVFYAHSTSRFATVSGGVNGADLVVTFVGDDGPVSAAMVEALVENIQYRNTASDPEAQRDFIFELDDGEGSAPLRYPVTVELTGSGVNAAPALDGLSSSVTFLRSALQSGPQVLDGEVVLTDRDTADFNGGRLTLSYDGVRVGTENQLGIQLSGMVSISGGVVSVGGNRIGVITSDGSNGSPLVIEFDTVMAVPIDIQELVESLTYGNRSDSPDTSVGLRLEIEDGDGATTGKLSIRVDIALDPLAQDDAVSGTEDTLLVTPIGDLLANDLGFGASMHISAVGNATGGVAQIVGDNIFFMPSLNHDGPASFDYTVTDGINTRQATVAVSLAAVNDAPTLSGVVRNVSATEDRVSALGLSGLTFSDVEGDALTVTLSASAGTLSATSGGGVTVSGSGSGSLILSGTTAALNGFFDGARAILYTGTANSNGNDAATVTVSARDGNGGSLAVDPVIHVDIAAVNDAPVGSPAISGTAIQGQTLTADGSAVSDIEGFNPAFVSWQWLRDGVAIAGATSSSLVLTVDDVGSAISVRLSYTDGGGTLESVVSGETAPVRYGDQTIVGGSSADVLRGRYGNDLILGGDGGDTITGGKGDDTLRGGAGDDAIYAWRGNDLVAGGEGNDSLFGGMDSDTLRGRKGNDIMYGRGGDDLLLAGLGGDSLRGGHGDDTLTGGGGADTFRFGRSDGDDLITDFGLGDDRIEVTKGARGLDDLSFTRKGDDVLVAYAFTTITVENILVTDLRDESNFLFT